MKYLVMECGLSYAVVLDQDGRILKVPNLGYTVGQTLEDVLLRFQLEDVSFSHTQNGGSDLTATTQALYALAAAQRQRDGKATLYDMTEGPQG